MALQPNESLGEFVIVREIGRGGMGTVYEAVQTSLNRRVALKTLSRGMVDDEKAIARFRREAEAVAKLNQPGIVPIYCVAEERGIHFYVMELVNGRPMSDLLSETRHLVSSGGRVSSLRSSPARSGESSSSGEFRDRPTIVKPGEPPSSSTFGPTQKKEGLGAPVSLDSEYVRDACDIMAQVAEAVDHVHRRRVVHRDIKPQNVLINEEGQAKITDFGLARYEGDMSLTEMGKAVGTPLYMSPEQVAGGNIGLDKRTDIYSLGASLYEMLTLRPPFTGDSREAVYKQIMLDEPTRPRRLNPSLPGDLETIVLKAIEKDPALRYQSAQELGEDLQRFLNDEPIWARPPGPLVRTTKWVRRNRALAATGAVAALLVLTTATGLIVHSRASRRREAQDAMQSARECREQGDLRRASERCSQALALWPGLADAQRELGRIEEQMAKEEDARRERERQAERRREASQRTAQGCALVEDVAQLRITVDQMRQSIAELRKTVKEHDPPERKAKLWDLETELRRLEQLRQQQTVEAVGQLLSAIRIDPQDTLAKATLADVYWQKLREAEATRRMAQADYFAELVRVYDEAGQYAEQLRGEGTLEIDTSPPGAQATLYTYVEDGPLLVPEAKRVLGQTPIPALVLPMGSYLLIVEKPGYSVTRYPILVERQERKQVRVTLNTSEEVGDGFVYVPSGEFLMGTTNPDQPKDAIRKVSAKSFFIAKHELTCTEYREFILDIAKKDIEKARRHLPRYQVDSGHYWKLKDGQFVHDGSIMCPPDGTGIPVHSISHRDAHAYCEWRSKRDGVKYRLPTSVEWEKAARGADGRLYPWGNQFDPALCNMRDSRKDGINTEPVGSRPHDCSPYGVMDMAGNRLEWCGNTDRSGTCAVQRGGSFGHGAAQCRCSYYRMQGVPNVSTPNGIRLVKDVPPR